MSYHTKWLENRDEISLGQDMHWIQALLFHQLTELHIIPLEIEHLPVVTNDPHIKSLNSFEIVMNTIIVQLT